MTHNRLLTEEAITRAVCEVPRLALRCGVLSVNYVLATLLFGKRVLPVSVLNNMRWNKIQDIAEYKADCVL